MWFLCGRFFANSTNTTQLCRFVNLSGWRNGRKGRSVFPQGMPRVSASPIQSILYSNITKAFEQFQSFFRLYILQGVIIFFIVHRLVYITSNAYIFFLICCVIWYEHLYQHRLNREKHRMSHKNRYFTLEQDYINGSQFYIQFWNIESIHPMIKRVIFRKSRKKVKLITFCGQGIETITSSLYWFRFPALFCTCIG